jgi:hypothetical protein
MSENKVLTKVCGSERGEVESRENYICTELNSSTDVNGVEKLRA